MLWNSTSNAVTSNSIRICMYVLRSTQFHLALWMTTKWGFSQDKPLRLRHAEAVGQRMGFVPSIVLAQFVDEEGSLGEGQNVQNLGRECSKLQFTIHTHRDNLTLTGL